MRAQYSAQSRILAIVASGPAAADHRDRGKDDDAEAGFQRVLGVAPDDRAANLAGERLDELRQDDGDVVRLRPADGIAGKQNECRRRFARRGSQEGVDRVARRPPAGGGVRSGRG